MKSRNIILLCLALIMGLATVGGALGAPVTLTEPTSDICGTYVFTVTTEPLGFSNCTLYDISTGGTGYLAYTANTSALQTSWSISLDTTAIPETSYQLNVTCFALNGTTEDWQDGTNDTTIDRTAPVLTYTSATPSNNAIDDDATFTVAVTSDEILTSAYFYRDDGRYAATSSIITGGYGVTYGVTPDAIPYGVYKYKIYAIDNSTDSSGNYCNAGTSAVRSITADKKNSKGGMAVAVGTGLVKVQGDGEVKEAKWHVNANVAKGVKVIAYVVGGIIALWLVMTFLLPFLPWVIIAAIIGAALFVLSKVF